jgi:tRNA (cmo5U34)-methyltransferase
MIERASRRREASDSIRFVVSPVEDLKFDRADLAICFYTLQFVPVRHRLAVLTRLRRALEPHGVLILFEKILASTGREQDIAEAAYFEFKRRRGFSDDEILAKRRSLRGVLQSFTAVENYALLQQAGFTDLVQVFRWLIFDGVIAYPQPA